MIISLFLLFYLLIDSNYMQNILSNFKIHIYHIEFILNFIKNNFYLYNNIKRFNILKIKFTNFINLFKKLRIN